MNARALLVALLCPVALAACAHDATSAASSVTTSSGSSSALVQAAAAPALPMTHGDARAALGQPAPDFTLVDTEGKTVHLADYAGKVVVLEWFNPECPFVNAAHLKASLKGMAARREAQGIVWLAINSAGEGKQGYGAEKTRAGKAKLGLDHPILLDPTGAVGHAYGATNTPNMYVIDASGTLVYRGAIDNSPDGEGESPTGGKLVNYVDLALDDVAAKRPVGTPETKAYGCGVKFR